MLVQCDLRGGAPQPLHPFLTERTPIIKIGTINPGGITMPHKRAEMEDWLRVANLDIIGINETNTIEELENQFYFSKYRTVFASLDLHETRKRWNVLEPNATAERIGTALAFRREIRCVKETKGEGILKGRVVHAVLCFENQNYTLPIHFISVYAPTDPKLKPAFFNALIDFTRIVRNEVRAECIILGDMNCTTSKEREDFWSLDGTSKGPDGPFIEQLCTEIGLKDTIEIAPDYDVRKYYTYHARNYSYKSRLDTILTSCLEGFIMTGVIAEEASHLITKHRGPFAVIDLGPSLKGPISIAPLVQPRKILCFNALKLKKLYKYTRECEKWEAKYSALIDEVINATGDHLVYLYDFMEEILDALHEITVEKAREIWNAPKKDIEIRSRSPHAEESRIAIARLTFWIKKLWKHWNRKAEGRIHDWADSREKVLNFEQEIERFTEKKVNIWKALEENDLNTIQLLSDNFKQHRSYHREALIAEERSILDEIKERSKDQLEKEAEKNSKILRVMRFRRKSLSEAGAILDSRGNLILNPQGIRNRYQEHFTELLKAPPINNMDTDPPPWYDTIIADNNRSKLEDVASEEDLTALPTWDEFVAALNKGETNSMGGLDGLQYGAIKLASKTCQLFAFGIIKILWYNQKIPEQMKLVEIVPIQKPGDPLRMENKRGIGLASKLLMIFEGIVINRTTVALEKANTRSDGQGGARRGVRCSDVINAAVNIIANALRNKQELHVTQLDIRKFFDEIPHPAFERSLSFFGFPQAFINIHKLFWEGYKAIIRSPFGPTNPINMNKGNIQGLRGSPLRSSLFLDMVILTLERDRLGYRMATRSGWMNRHELPPDMTNLYVPSLNWIDDLNVFARSARESKHIVNSINNFLEY
eukprot:TRINITY_DN8916_c0_g1_i1.p1 TRINITY_DN8916_c0_g1~~TRINITY_DN8916_c0_g1_i1.p1  ORF type:complete len:879 (+),score=162.16 TRINITY_DN8916_c0_g1_i1:88-2724(+)